MMDDTPDLGLYVVAPSRLRLALGKAFTFGDSLANTKRPPPARNEAIAAALLVMPREEAVEGSLQHLPGEAKNNVVKLDKAVGTEENPVTG
jgi:hypothetical protein